MLIRDKTVKISIFLQSADENVPQEGDPKIDAIPRMKDELRKYDVICLIDPNPAAFDASSWRT